MRVQRFRDFDDFASSIHGVESRMLLRDPEDASWSITQIQLGEIEVQVGKLGSGNIAAGELKTRDVMVYLPLTKGVEYIGNGQTIHPDGCFVIEPGAEFCICTRKSHDWAAISLPPGLFTEQTLDSLSHQCRAALPRKWISTRLRSMIEEVLRTATASAEFESSTAAVLAGEALQRLATPIIEVGEADDDTSLTGRPRVSRHEVIRCVLERIAQAKDTPLTLDELALTANVSQRTLRSVFREYFGVGPVQYMQTRRLNRIHRVLRDADPASTTVTQILIEHNEFAHGRFAKRYEKLFGELPSTTLARSVESH